MTIRFFRLRDDVALDAAGEPEPIKEVGVAVLRPALSPRGELVETVDRVVVGPHPADARVVATDDPQIANGIVATGLFVEVDPPDAKRSRKPAPAGDAGETTDAREA